MIRDYLGDGAYATHDGFNLVLTTGHHEEDQADNVIYLEPLVWKALCQFMERVKAVPTDPEPVQNMHTLQSDAEAGKSQAQSAGNNGGQS